MEAYRTKDVRISLRFDMTWKHRDLNYSEINYEIQRKEKLHDENFKAQKDEVEVIDVLHGKQVMWYWVLSMHHCKLRKHSDVTECSLF